MVIIRQIFFRKRILLWQYLFVIIALCFISDIRADWINLSGAETAPNIAEVYVMDDHVRLVLEVYIGDLAVFEDLVPDGWLKDRNKNRPAVAERVQRFAEHRVQIIDDSGARLTATLEQVEPRIRKDRQSPFAGMINPITRQRVAEPPADKRVLYAELIYPFTKKPAALTFIPPLDEAGRAAVTIGFIVYHKAVPVIDFRYLGAPVQLNLNWDDPWYSRFDNPNLKRHHKDALMSFLYVEPFEVRHEILTRVRDLTQWMDLGLRGERYIEIDELEPLKKRIGEFLLTKNPVRVDGQILKPILDRSSFVKVGLTGIQLLEKPERLEISTAIVGVIIAYITQGMPKEVRVDWELFTERIQRVPASAIDPAGPLMSYLTPDDSVHTWTNFLKNYQLPTVASVMVDAKLATIRLPLGSIICLVLLLVLVIVAVRRGGFGTGRKRLLAGGLGTMLVAVAAGLALVPWASIPITRPAMMTVALGDEQAQTVLHELLKNVYRAFDFRAEEDVYDKLALSVDGDLLADLYLQNRRSFAVEQAGGAQAEVKTVEVLGASAKPLNGARLGYALNSRWTALGTVGHWGHVHTRQNLYQAIVTLEVINKAWKITGLELLDEKRVDPNTAQTNKAGSSPGPSG